MIEFEQIEAQNTPELQLARRAFPTAQRLLRGGTLREASPAAQIGWHGTEVTPETGSVAVVPTSGPLADLVGEIVVVRRIMPTEIRSVFAYVIGAAPIVDDLSLARRPFLALGLLANESLTCSVEVVA